MGTLYLVATPIGNLEDITLRALRILKEVSIVAAEDTRRTKKLLSHYEIFTYTISYHEHNKSERIPYLMEKLESGDVALVSDAGTPVINDPGYLLVQASLENGHPVVPIPGANAPITALVASGLPADRFLYMGYLPKKKTERQQALESVSTLNSTLVLLETPHRLVKSLEELRKHLGSRKIAVARELTKMHEEFFRGTIDEAITRYTEVPPRGEITLVIDKAPDAPEKWSRDQLNKAIKKSLSKGISSSEIARELAKESGWRRREIYKLLTQTHSEEKK